MGSGAEEIFRRVKIIEGEGEWRGEVGGRKKKEKSEQIFRPELC